MHLILKGRCNVVAQTIISKLFFGWFLKIKQIKISFKNVLIDLLNDRLNEFYTTYLLFSIKVSNQVELDLKFNFNNFIDDNTGPSQCEEIRVFLKDLPIFTRLQVRENVTFECTVIGNKVAQQFIWYKDGAVRSLVNLLLLLFASFLNVLVVPCTGWSEVVLRQFLYIGFSILLV